MPIRRKRLRRAGTKQTVRILKRRFATASDVLSHAGRRLGDSRLRVSPKKFPPDFMKDREQPR